MSDPHLSPWRAAGRISRYRIGLFSVEFVRLVAWNTSMLVIGWLLQQLFDALSGSASAGFGGYEILAVLAAAEAARLTVIWSGVVGDRCWQYMRGLMRLNLLRALLQSGGPDAGASATSSGETVSRFRDDVDDLLAFLQSVTLAAGKVVLLVGSMVIMLSVEPVVAVAVVLPLVSVVVVTRLASTRIRTYRAAYRRSSAAVTGLIAEVFGSVLAVKSADAVDDVVQHLGRLNERRRRTGLKDHLVAQLLGRFNRATVDLSVGVVLLLSAPAMHGGGFTVGDLALFVNYTSLLVWVPYYIGQMLSRHRQAGVAIDRMTALLPAGKPGALVTHRPLDAAEQPSGPNASGAHAPLERLTVCGVTATHAPSSRGIFTVSLTIERGTFTVVTGPAGAGKTTLLRTVLGLVALEGGAVYWNDEVVRDRAAFLVPPRSAYVPQVPGLFSESLRENLLLGHEDAAALRSAVHAAVLERDVVSMPSGIDTQVGARGVRLSGGQVQRAAIARALVRRTDLLVLDDVSSALDVETERQLWDRLRADGDRTLLVVSNRPATIARADQVIRLDQGRVQSGSVRPAISACIAA